jgi:hypothetical protein
LFVLLALLTASALTRGAIINVKDIVTGDGTHDSLKVADVQATHNLATTHDGDTLLLPTATETWSATLTVTKAITLQGATTVVRNSESSFTVVDLTVIKDGNTGTTASAGSLIYLNMPRSSADTKMGIKGITLDGNLAGASGTNGYIIFVGGVNHQFRMTQVHFTKTHTWFIFMNDTTADLLGVIDHCYTEQDTGSEQFWMGNGSYSPDGGTYTNGDGSWKDGPQFGSDKFLFWEDNYFTGGAGVIDGRGGPADGVAI